jgi:hypothetical protein
MENDPGDDEATLAKSGTVLCSDGQNTAQAYATAELRDTQRPTVEMDRVQINDPRDARTIPSARPDTAAASDSVKPLIGSEPPTIEAETGRPRAFAEALRTAAAIPAPPPLPAFPMEPIRDEPSVDRATVPVPKPAPQPAIPSTTPAPIMAAAPAPPPRQGSRALVAGVIAIMGIAAVVLFVIGLRGGAAPAAPAPASTTEAAPRAAQPPAPLPPPAQVAPEPVATAAPSSQAAAEAPPPSAPRAATPAPEASPPAAQAAPPPAPAAPPPAPIARTARPATAKPTVTAETPPAPTAPPSASSHRLFGVEN